MYAAQPGRRLSHFECLESALKFVEARADQEKLVFLHTGRYAPEPISISSAVQIIGASKDFCGKRLNVGTSSGNPGFLLELK